MTIHLLRSMLFVLVAYSAAGDGPSTAPHKSTGSASASPAAPCEERPELRTLDFWIGDWDVLVGGTIVGSNRIEKILSGCAVLEHWRSARGGNGKSLFFFVPHEDTWKQIWITENVFQPGGVKEKELTEHLEGGAIRFQGAVTDGERGTYLDRTTLTPTSPDEVRQVIEVSLDDGKSWRPVFDAKYVRKERRERN